MVFFLPRMGIPLDIYPDIARTYPIYTSIKIIKNEVGCRDDTVPKTADTRRHCEEEWEHATIFRNPQKHVGMWLRKIVACSHSSSQCLLVSAVFGKVSSLHFIFILVSLIFLSRLSLDCSARRDVHYARYIALHVQPTRTRMRIVRANKTVTCAC